MVAAAFVAFTALATVASAKPVLSEVQNILPLSYGRFPCTVWDKNGKMRGDNDLCKHDNIVATGVSLVTAFNFEGYKRDGPIPVNSVCQQDPHSGGYYCGIDGAKCDNDECCDNGRCDKGKCTGGYGHQTDSNNRCLGYLWSTDSKGHPTGGCGEYGSYCKDWSQSDLSQCKTDEERWTRYDSNCKSGYCNSVSGQCDIKVLTVAGDCTADPQHSCGDGLDPVIDSRGKCTCQSKNKGSHRPKPDEKSRRSIRLAEALCPRSHTVCHVGSKDGFECVDTQTSLEQCGGCASAGGVDCTTIPNVSAVGCVAGACEIWACDDGYEYNPRKNACVAA
ncbi:hypothetical protein JCM8202_002711 [Rhodotorula sphaerocarpa]